MEIKINIGDSKTKRTFKFDCKSPEAEQLIGKKIGEVFHGELLGLTGYEFEITGGSDKSGFPMKKEIEGQTKKKFLLEAGELGMKKKKKFKGLRKKKTIRGNTIATDTAQVNAKITKHGAEDLNVKFPMKVKEEKKEEAKPA